MFLLVVFSVLAGLVGCAGSPRQFALPTHIDFDVATGAWSVATAGVGGAEQLPEWVGVYSTWKGERCDGVRFVPGSAGFETMVVSSQRAPGRRIEDNFQILFVPNFIELATNTWVIRMGDKSVNLSDGEIYNSEIHEVGCLWMRVPLHGVRDGDRSVESGIKRQTMTCEVIMPLIRTGGWQ